MTTTRLESLKAEHPEWCWNCGACDHESTGGICINSDSPVIAALVAALEEAEARLAATERLNAKLREALEPCYPLAPEHLWNEADCAIVAALALTVSDMEEPHD